MAITRGTGLLMAWCDVLPEHEDAFNEWYDREHINHLLQVPGFLSGGRLFENERTCIGVHEGASACCNHLRLPIDKARDYASFTIAEMIFTKPLENFGN